jgi:hypothetical protein
VKTALVLILAALMAAAQSAHSVTLTWQDAVNPAGTQYNVYRSPGPCTAPTFVKLASALAVKSYTDLAVTSAGTYCYAVTASSAGAESAKSVSAGAVIPADLAIPTSLVTVVVTVSGP